MKQTFYSNGKLLITGEYTVLDGAAALALPTKHGQYLTVEDGINKNIHWESLDADGSLWFKASVTVKDIIAKRLSGEPVTDTLIDILNAAHKVNQSLLSENKGFNVATKLTFPRSWGLGTSSTLINNIAQWFKIDAFELLKQSFGGSGYDIACAQHNYPITYRIDQSLPVVQEIAFKPAFADKLWFVYLNQKQNSRSAIAAYRNRQNDILPTIQSINAITAEISATGDLSSFCRLLEKHEAIMSDVLGLPTIKESLFPDFKGTLKSLGAWGGDFILAASDEDTREYFASKGYTTVIPYSEMIL